MNRTFTFMSWVRSKAATTMVGSADGAWGFSMCELPEMSSSSKVKGSASPTPEAQFDRRRMNPERAVICGDSNLGEEEGRGVWRGVGGAGRRTRVGSELGVRVGWRRGGSCSRGPRYGGSCDTRGGGARVGASKSEWDIAAVSCEKKREKKEKRVQNPIISRENVRRLIPLNAKAKVVPR